MLMIHFGALAREAYKLAVRIAPLANKLWVRVSPGAETSFARSEGLSTSSAIPGKESTTHGLPVARAAARCGLKLSLPKRSGKVRRDGGMRWCPSVAGGNNDGAFSGALHRNLIEFGSLNQGNVAGNHQRAFDSCDYAKMCGHRDGSVSPGFA